MTAVKVNGLWWTDPRDGVPHAWRQVVDPGVWVAACGWRAADGSVLTDPADGTDRCAACTAALSLAWLLQHGAELADRRDAAQAEAHRRQQAALRAERGGP